LLHPPATPERGFSCDGGQVVELLMDEDPHVRKDDKGMRSFSRRWRDQDDKRNRFTAVRY